MTDYYQTDSKMIFRLPHECEYSFLVKPVDETSSGRADIYSFIVPQEPSLIKSAWDTIRVTENREVAEEARGLVSVIQEIIATFQQSGFDLGYLPPLQAFNLDDGSVVIEWIFSDFRVGFNVEPNSDESGWYLVSNESLGAISASGFTSNIDVKRLILWLLNFILSNS